LLIIVVRGPPKTAKTPDKSPICKFLPTPEPTSLQIRHTLAFPIYVLALMLDSEGEEMTATPKGHQLC
jgi:hypothetical protein